MKWNKMKLHAKVAWDDIDDTDDDEDDSSSWIKGPKELDCMSVFSH